MARAARWIPDIGQDCGFAVRLLAKERWFSAASILALSLGMGVTTMVVTIVNGYNFRGLPVDDPERVMYIGTRDRSGRDGGVSYQDYRAWKSARSFDATGAFAGAVMTIGDEGQAAESVGGAHISHEVFDILGETPLLGRRIRIEDDRPGAASVVLLGHRLWSTRYNGDAGIVGRSVLVNGTPATVIGVMRQGFEFPFREAAWQPLAQLPGLDTLARDARVLGVIGRLANDAGPDQARAELSAIAATTTRELPTASSAIEPLVGRFGLQQVGRLADQQPPLAALATAVFVLLIACANVANLLLARSARRARELAIRASVGATRWRIVRQLLVESLLLAVVSGALGTWLSRFGVRFVADAFGRNVPYWMHFPVDGRVLAVVIALCAFSTLAFGILPALGASRTQFGSLLKDAGRTVAGPPTRRWTQALLTAEVAVTLMLLAGAGLMVRSFLVVYRTDRVIDASRALTAEIALPQEKYVSPAQRSAFYLQLDERLSRSGVSAAIASARPFTGGRRQRVSLRERPAIAGPGQAPVVVVAVGDRYFETLQLPVLRGRYFESHGSANDRTAIVNQRFAELFYPNEDPVGRQIRLEEENTNATSAPWLTIVGVSPTIRQSVASGAGPVVYVPLASHAGTRAAIIVGHLVTLRGVAPLLRQEVASVDREVTLFNVRPLRDLLDDSRLQPRLIGTLIAAFASIALLLSVVGLYASTAYGVQQRTHEIGVRMALGAQAREVVLLFVRRAMLPLAAGSILGLAGALVVGKLLQGLLIHTSPADPATLACMVSLLVSVSLLACWLPSRKAAQLDPLVVLRHD